MKIAAAAGGGLFLGFNWSDTTAAPVVIDGKQIAAGSVKFNSYLSIGADNSITIVSPNPEIGQGIKTAFPMVVAEELDADWKLVKTVQGNLDNTQSADVHFAGRQPRFLLLQQKRCLGHFVKNGLG